MKHEKIFTQFYVSFLKLCSESGITPSTAAKQAGISSGAPTAWKNGAVPKPAQREKLCDLFGVTDDVLLGYTKKEPAGHHPNLTSEELSLISALRNAPSDVQSAVHTILSAYSRNP